MLVLRPTMKDEERDQELARFQAFLQKQGATGLSDLVRGRQRLAYPIKRCAAAPLPMPLLQLPRLLLFYRRARMAPRPRLQRKPSMHSGLPAQSCGAPACPPSVLHLLRDSGRFGVPLCQPNGEWAAVAADAPVP